MAGANDEQVAPGAEDAEQLGGAGLRVQHDDEIEEAIRERQGAGPAGLERHPALGVEAEAVDCRPHGSLGAVDTAHPGRGKLAGEEESSLGDSGAHDQHPFRRRHAQDGRRQRRERGRTHSRDVLTARPAARSPRVPAVQGQGPDRRLIILAGFALIAVAVVAAILIGRSGGGSEGGSSTTAGPNGCKEVEPPEPKQVSLKAPKQTVQKGEKLTAVVRTSCGTFDIALATGEAPKTANSFAYLAEEGFYDDLTFHRVIPGFVVQGGDPLGTGSGGPGYSVDERPPGNLSYTKGTVAMAKTGAEPPGRSGSQFFVVVEPDAGLPPEYALVGKVDKGYDVVARIAKQGTPEGTPKQTIVMEKVTIEHG
jgi:peptidyl-prolyl cis-trans isomerase B (cyclophilin B)